MLCKVIEDGFSDETKPKDRLAIYMKLSQMLDDLTQDLHIENDAAKKAHEFLKQGSMLVQAKSRFTATQTTVTIESDP
jgi:hypothetical protein